MSDQRLWSEAELNALTKKYGERFVAIPFCKSEPDPLIRAILSVLNSPEIPVLAKVKK